MNRQKKLALLIVLALALITIAPASAQDLGTTSAASTPAAYWVGEYFNNPELAGEPAVILFDPAINFDWGAASPVQGIISPDHFSVRWSRTLVLQPGRYQFTVTVDDGVRLWVNDQAVIDQWAVHQAQPFTATVTLPGGATPVRMEYFEDTNTAVARLAWTSVVSPTQATTTGGAASGVVTGTQILNVRNGPGTSFAQIATLAAGQTVGLTGRNTDATWLQINLPGGGAGWVSGFYIAPNALLTSLPVSEAIASVPSIGGQTTAVVTGTQILNVRTGPGLGFNTFTTLNAGQSIGLEGRDASATWIQVSLPDNQLGWVSSEFITPNVPLTDLPVVQTTTAPSAVGTPVASGTPNTGGQATGEVAGTPILIVRSGPGTQFSQLATLNLAQSVGLEGRDAEATWVQVRLPDGQLGWVSRVYIRPNLTLNELPVVQ